MLYPGIVAVLYIFFVIRTVLQLRGVRWKLRSLSKDPASITSASLSKDPASITSARIARIAGYHSPLHVH
jgi:hypothetical protein